MTTLSPIQKEFSNFQAFQFLVKKTEISFAEPRFIKPISERPAMEASVLKFLLDFFKTAQTVSQYGASLFDHSGFNLTHYIWNHLNSFEPDAQKDMVRRVQLAAALFRPQDFQTLEDVTTFAVGVKKEFITQLCTQSHSVLCQKLLHALWRGQGVISEELLQEAKKRFIDSRAPDLSLPLPSELMQEVFLRCQALYQMQKAIKEVLSRSFTIHASHIFALVQHLPFHPTLERIQNEIYWALRIVRLHRLPPAPAEQAQLQLWFTWQEHQVNRLLFPIVDACTPLFSFGDLFISQLGIPKNEVLMKEFEYQRRKDPYATHDEIVTRASTRGNPSHILLLYKWWWFSLKRSTHSALESAIQWLVAEVRAKHREISADAALSLVKEGFENQFPLLPFEENHAKTRILKPLPLSLPDGAEEEHQKKAAASLKVALSLEISLDPLPLAEVLEIPTTNDSQKQAEETTQKLSPP